MGNSEAKQRGQLLYTIQSNCGYWFKNKQILEEALTHDSCRLTNPEILTYERLEYLGDSFLGWIITDYLFRKYLSDNEGDLSRKRSDLVSSSMQRKIADKLRIDEYIKFDKSVQNQNSGQAFRKYDKFVEALIGGIYIDGGFEKAKSIVYNLWGLDELGSCIIC
ncbi:unnamed protein product [Didymodactylos carnosus]|uniref:RNase III domain-containing protein n=1 Tax=Didymodactylos carnosus TaxID=1234261 RepID=A0A8S2FWN3_9BILA|nr:unnamed protein product [Didymodactylos carnosus]CAF4368255.1 unnamed protein product [Didymodactylos carnosus]